MTAKSVNVSVLAACAALSSLAAPAPAQFDVLKNLGRSATATKKIACFKIEGALAETPTRMPPLFGEKPPTSLKSLLARFKQARRDNNVVAVVVDLQEAALGLAQLEELHAALRQFAAVDKEVFVHADSLRTLSYTAATGASHVCVVPTGDVWLSGFYAETPYLRGALDKLGITPDFEQCGSHKSAAESLVRTGPSDAAREMMTWLFDGMYKTLVRRVLNRSNQR